MLGFSGILGTGQVEDQKMMKDKLIDGKKTVSRFRGKLEKMNRDVVVNLHWSYKLTKKEFFSQLTN